MFVRKHTAGGLFTETVIRTMAKNVDRPMIFALSNPTDKAECTPRQAYEWTDGKAPVAAGVQFPDLTAGGKVFHPRPGKQFFEQDQATVGRPDDIRSWIKSMTYKPVYGAECTA